MKKNMQKYGLVHFYKHPLKKNIPTSLTQKHWFLHGFT